MNSPITNTRRTVCYDQLLCDDDTRVEGDEAFNLIIYTNEASVIIDPGSSSATIVILNDDGESFVITNKVSNPSITCIRQDSSQLYILYAFGF